MSSDTTDPIYDRSRNRFFGRVGTKNSIVEIADADKLIIYCGAGVTIDRTGLSWRDLIANLLIQESQLSYNPEEASEMIAPDRLIEILGRSFTPLQMASGLGLARMPRIDGEEETAIGLARARLQALLYDNYGWQSGVLAKNVIRLAVSSAVAGKRVIIVTTNYDDYLEQSFKKLIDSSGLDAQKLPGLRLLSPWRLHNPVVVRESSSLDVADVDIVYLHGRVSEDSLSLGPLVITEHNYHCNYETLYAYLCDLFSRDDPSLLVLGSSLTDPPLLGALTATRGRSGRYALFPAEATGLIGCTRNEFTAIKKRYVTRGSHFGVQILIPDFFFQVAQFCQEIVTCLEIDSNHGGSNSYIATESMLTYGARLVSWWRRWKQVDRHRGVKETHRELRDFLKTFREYLSPRVMDEETGVEREQLKVELWVRAKPKKSRHLVLWSSSSGVLHDRRILRAEELQLDSHNASVRAFLAGQPQYLSREDLLKRAGVSTAQSRHLRWKSYLSVPIRLESTDEALDIPVGVLTIASMRPKIATNGERGSAIPADDNEAMEELIGLLINFGRKLLDA